jgi:small subunit ribosomal protein S3
MDRGALGCEIIMSGKLKGPRGRMEKMVNGYIKHCGSIAEEIVDRGYAIAKKKAGVIGVRVWIVKPDSKVPNAFRMNVVNVVNKEVEKEGEEKKKEGEGKEIEIKEEKESSKE